MLPVLPASLDHNPICVKCTHPPPILANRRQLVDLTGRRGLTPPPAPSQEGVRSRGQPQAAVRDGLALEQTRLVAAWRGGSPGRTALEPGRGCHHQRTPAQAHAGRPQRGAGRRELAHPSATSAPRWHRQPRGRAHLLREHAVQGLHLLRGGGRLGLVVPVALAGKQRRRSQNRVTAEARPGRGSRTHPQKRPPTRTGS